MRTDPRHPTRRLAVVLTLAGLAFGCGDDEPPPGMLRVVIDKGEVPEKITAAAKKAMPGVAVVDAWKNIDAKSNALHSYELRGRAANGKIREVRVSPDGDVLESE